MADILTNGKSEFYDGWNAAFTAQTFEETDDVPLPREGFGIVPGKA